MSIMRKSFVVLGQKQDLICKDYEAEADIIQKQMNLNDMAPSSSGLAKNVPMHQTGLGQSAAEAEVLSLVELTFVMDSELPFLYLVNYHFFVNFPLRTSG